MILNSDFELALDLALALALGLAVSQALVLALGRVWPGLALVHAQVLEVALARALPFVTQYSDRIPKKAQRQALDTGPVHIRPIIAFTRGKTIAELAGKGTPTWKG